MEQFVAGHAGHVVGTLSGSEQLVLRGIVRMLAHRGGMMGYLSHVGVLLKDFGKHASSLTKQPIDASTASAKRLGRRERYLRPTTANKEEIAHVKRPRGACIPATARPYAALQHKGGSS